MRFLMRIEKYKKSGRFFSFFIKNLSLFKYLNFLVSFYPVAIACRFGIFRAGNKVKFFVIIQIHFKTFFYSIFNKIILYCFFFSIFIWEKCAGYTTTRIYN